MYKTKQNKKAKIKTKQTKQKDNTFDIAISAMSLHWINNLGFALKEILRVIKPDAPFLACIPGDNTLQELRSSLIMAEKERYGGIGTHISPMIKIGEVGSIFGNAGFNLVTVDNEYVDIPFPNMFLLCEHLKGAGDTHCGYNREVCLIFFCVFFFSCLCFHFLSPFWVA